MVTFDEMRRDQVALKQQVEKLREDVDSFDKINASLCPTLGIKYDKDFGFIGTNNNRFVQIENKIAAIQQKQEELERANCLWAGTDENGDDKYEPQTHKDMLDTISFFYNKCSDANKKTSDTLEGISNRQQELTQKIASLEKYIDNDHECVISNVSQMINNEVERIYSEINKLYKNSEKIDQNNVDLLKKFNAFKDEVNRKVGDNKIDVDNLVTLITNLEKRVDKYDDEITVKFLEKKINEQQAATKKVLAEKDAEIHDLEKRLNNLTDRLIKLEGTAVRSPVVEQPVKEAEVEWYSTTQCIAEIKKKFPELKEMKNYEFYDAMVWSKYISGPTPDDKHRKVGTIGLKLNAVRYNKKCDVEYNPAFIDKFADRVLKHRKASSEFQCKGVEE